MKRFLVILLCLVGNMSAKSWTKGLMVHWVSKNPSAISVFNEKTGKRIGDLKNGRLHQLFENFQIIEWSIRDGDGKVLEKGTAKVESYEYPKDSMLQQVPQGRVTQHIWNESEIYPETEREYLVYVPDQYSASKPAALMVFQDGLRHADPNGNLRATTVMDNLIANGEMPVTLGIFINPGRFKDQGLKEKPRNRSVEYDSLGDTYARFLLEEIIPKVEKSYSISDDPKMRGIAGGSSGGICAWTVCWEKPQSFRKALIWVGTFVDIRGGHNYPPMVRKMEKKPIRAYLLAGENDLDNKYGNWPLANKQMAAALKYSDYDYHFHYGKCFHGSNAAGAKLPEMMRWLWRDWKK
jgi:enterochelin esterase family protein